MLSLYKLEIFSVVVQQGSFSSAAEHLHLTQPAVSQHIHDLEASLGTRLFDRGRRGVAMTDSGEKLYEYTCSILRMVVEAENAVTEVHNLLGGQVRIGATPGVSAYLLPEWIQKFRVRYPKLTVALHTGITPTVMNDVLARRMDIGFIEGELPQELPDKLGILPLQSVELFVIVGQGHQWWERGSVNLSDLNGEPFIHRQQHSQTRIWLESIFAENNLNVPTVAEFDNQESIKQAVVSGMGITILPLYAIEHELENERLKALQTRDYTLQRMLKLLWNDMLTVKPIARAFLSEMQDEFEQLAQILD